MGNNAEGNNEIKNVINPFEDNEDNINRGRIDEAVNCLLDLTGQESGIIVWSREQKSVGVFSWSGCGNYSLPYVLSPIEIIPRAVTTNLYDGVSKERVDDIYQELPGTVWIASESIDNDVEKTYVLDTDMDIVYDYNLDIMQLYMDHRDGKKTPGWIYYLPSKNIFVIAPEDWN